MRRNKTNVKKKNKLTNLEIRANYLKQMEDKVNPTATVYLSTKELSSLVNYPVKQSVRIKRTAGFPGTIVSSTTLDVLGGISFSLSQIPNSGDVSTLFDEYKLEYVVVNFLPRQSETTSITDLGRLFIAVDYDDSTATTSVQQVQEYDTCVTHTGFSRPFSITFSPRASVAAYSGAFTSYASAQGMWMDVASPNVQYYGIKFGITTTTVVNTIDVTVDYYFKFRSSK